MSLSNRNGIWYYLFYVDHKRYRGSTGTRNPKSAVAVEKEAVAKVLAAMPEDHPYRRRSQPTPKRRPVHVYLIRAGEYHKIGIATCVATRLKDIQVANPISVELVGSWPSQSARELEQELHSMFTGKRVFGEWFALEPSDLEQINAYLTKRLM